ncbi:endo alpha-1,4 polygalactosaminidase [Mycetocola reblochoni]|uniref:endo alpha-1,4 polygalactosaminidase n=1 Tax=Mycetocola reblochoni TaxID=331618 RepID=UPI001FE5E4C7|nr:endo alpha-1,4 polygalactosaminidase [Mycetocola reblochoni]
MRKRLTAHRADGGRAVIAAAAATAATVAVLVLGGCVTGGTAADPGGAGSSAAAPGAGTSGPAAVPTSGRFDYQLGGPSDLVDGARPDVVVRDADAAPLEGAYSVCYVNGFQTQPGQEDVWAGSDAVLRDADDRPVVDPDWPDEMVLDPATPHQREQILAVIGPVITGCAEDGYAAVEIDNLDTFLRFPAGDDGSPGVDEAAALALARSYVDVAHTAGLAIGQKNAAELAARGRDELGFDFAVTEECAAFDECDAYRAAYGDAVLQIEYADTLPVPFDSVCAEPDRAALTILRDRDLVPAGTEGHVFRQCAVPSGEPTR